jgi:homoserine O-succinyltransferase
MNAISGAGDPKPDLVIGIVNNMPPTGFAAADAQLALMLPAGPRLRRFAPAGPTLSGYEPIEALWSSRLDGLIVTGAEPQAAAMTDEPAWPLLARLTDWAAEHTRAAIWSCLAAHAAVFRLDGVARRRLPRKLSGVFACRSAGAHPLLDGTPSVWPVPHSRFNDLDPAALERGGYTIVSHGPGLAEDDGADVFAKSVGRSAFLMLQGHPEYAADALRREYRRDLRRWQRGAIPDRPAPPRFYFDAEGEAALAGAPDAESCLAALDSIPGPAPHWLPFGGRLYQAWLAAVALPARAEVGLSTR